MTDLLEGLNDASGVVWVDFARSLNVWADPPTPGWGYGYGPGWRNPTRTRTLLYPAATGTRVRQPVTIPMSESPSNKPIGCPACTAGKTGWAMALAVVGLRHICMLYQGRGWGEGRRRL